MSQIHGKPSDIRFRFYSVISTSSCNHILLYHGVRFGRRTRFGLVGDTVLQVRVVWWAQIVVVRRRRVGVKEESSACELWRCIGTLICS
ncbi:hypothetical protein HKD37_01G000138 [Glycine soja]